MKIAFVYAGGREAKWQAALDGRVPSDFFYGAVELAKAGHDILCIDAPDPRRSLLAATYNLLTRTTAPVRTRGEHIAAVARNLSRLKSAAAVVAASTSHANALAFWKRLGLLRVPLIGIHCGHVNYSLPAARRRATSHALREQEIVLFADSEREETLRQFDIHERRIHANAFGVDTDFWTPGGTARDFILAVGNDGRRDYDTFVTAVSGIDVPVKILTARPLPDPLPRNIEHLRGSWHAPAVTDDQLRDLYRRALMVVIPLEDSIQPSGQSVALQAMACGRPVILTRTRGLWTGNGLREGQDLLLVEPGAPEALRHAMQQLLDDTARREHIGQSAREAALQHGRIDSFAHRLEVLIRSGSNPDVVP